MENNSRNPSFHVRREDLERLLEADKQLIAAAKVVALDFKKLADSLVKLGKSLTPLNRLQITTNTATRKKVVNSVKVTDELCSKFNGVLTSLRLAQNGRAGAKIMKDSAVQSQLKTACTAAVDFSEEFGMDYDKGFRKFSEIGLKLMGRKYALNKFASLRDKIAAEYHSELLVGDDDNPGGTKEFYTLWLDRLERESGVRIEFRDTDTSRYAEVLLARMDADKLNADYHTWIEAQFAGLAFVNAIPSLTQLHGMTAQERYQKLMFSKDKKLNDKLAGMKFMNDEERDYYIKYVFKQ